MIEYILNIGDVCVSDQPETTFTCLGLGSCIGLFFQDRVCGLTGGAHILLPTYETSDTSDGFFDVETAINELMDQFSRRGSGLMSLRAKLAGGANVLTSGFDTGAKNAARVQEELIRRRVYIAAIDVGGTKCRSVWFESSTGNLRVRIPETNQYITY